MQYIIHLTDNCNLNCSYCYEKKCKNIISFDNIKIDKEEIDKLIESKEQAAETIKDYTKAVQKLVDAGQVTEASLDTFEASLSQILNISQEYDYYCDDLIPILDGIIESDN